jgi:hypothetical protein
MSKSLNKYMRKFHRWLALPFIVIILTLLLTQGTVIGSLMQRLQQIMILTLAVTGAYLYLLPYWAKWQRRGRTERKTTDRVSA